MLVLSNCLDSMKKREVPDKDGSKERANNLKKDFTNYVAEQCLWMECHKIDYFRIDDFILKGEACMKKSMQKSRIFFDVVPDFVAEQKLMEKIFSKLADVFSVLTEVKDSANMVVLKRILSSIDEIIAMKEKKLELQLEKEEKEVELAQLLSKEKDVKAKLRIIESSDNYQNILPYEEKLENLKERKEDIELSIETDLQNIISSFQLFNKLEKKYSENISSMLLEEDTKTTLKLMQQISTRPKCDKEAVRKISRAYIEKKKQDYKKVQNEMSSLREDMRKDLSYIEWNDKIYLLEHLEEKITKCEYNLKKINLRIKSVKIDQRKIKLALLIKKFTGRVIDIEIT